MVLHVVTLKPPFGNFKGYPKLGQFHALNSEQKKSIVMTLVSRHYNKYCFPRSINILQFKIYMHINSKIVNLMHSKLKVIIRVGREGISIVFIAKQKPSG